MSLLGEALRTGAPHYLRPSAHGILLEPPPTASKCSKRGSTRKPKSSTASKAKGRSTSFESDDQPIAVKANEDGCL